MRYSVTFLREEQKWAAWLWWLHSDIGDFDSFSFSALSSSLYAFYLEGHMEVQNIYSESQLWYLCSWAENRKRKGITGKKATILCTAFFDIPFLSCKGNWEMYLLARHIPIQNKILTCHYLGLRKYILAIIITIVFLICGWTNILFFLAIVGPLQSEKYKISFSSYIHNLLGFYLSCSLCNDEELLVPNSIYVPQKVSLFYPFSKETKHFLGI